jgi:hypothetical protein
MADPLGELKNRRERRTRSAPAPRNPRPKAAEETEETEATKAETAEEQRQQDEPRRNPTPPPPSPLTRPRLPKTRERHAGPTAKPTRRTGELRLAQFYVDPELDQWLREVRADALLRGVNVSGSSVARLALRSLMEQISVRELVDYIEQQAEENPPQGRGRPRR